MTEFTGGKKYEKNKIKMPTVTKKCIKKKYYTRKTAGYYHKIITRQREENAGNKDRQSTRVQENIKQNSNNIFHFIDKSLKRKIY